MSSTQVKIGNSSVEILGVPQYLTFTFILVVYTRFIICNVRPGLPRFLLTLPLVALNSIIPAYLVFDGASVFYNMQFVIFNTYICNMRLIAFCLNRGVLTRFNKDNEGVSVLALMLLLPVILSVGKQKQEKDDKDLSILQKIGLYVLIYSVLFSIRDRVSDYIQSFFHGTLLYIFISLPMDIFGFILNQFEIQVEPSFQKPYMSKTTREFWSKRWDIAIAQTFRDLVFGPIVEGKLIAEGSYTDTYKKLKSKQIRVSPYRITAATFGTFLLSAVMHQLTFWLFSGRNDWSWFWFFISQHGLIIIEAYIYGNLKKQLDIEVSPIVSNIVTMTIQAFLATHLFFRPFKREMDLACDVLDDVLIGSYTFVRQQINL